MEIKTLKNEAEALPDTEEIDIPSELPILALDGNIVLPLTMVPLNIGQQEAIKLVHDAVISPSRIIGLFGRKIDSNKSETNKENVYHLGTAALILRLLHKPDNSVHLIVQGIDRIRIKEFTATNPYLKAKVERAVEHVEQTQEVEALMRNTIELLRHLVSLAPHLPEELLITALNIRDPRQLVYILAVSLRLELSNSQNLLELDNVTEKLQQLNSLLMKDIEILELGKKIQTQAQNELEKSHRNYLLREQMKQIKKELGEDNEEEETLKHYEEKINTIGMSEVAKKEARREFERLKLMSPSSAEYHVIRTYLDWLVELPWSVSTKDNLEIERAKKILDEDHYDLKDIKERILEFLAVRKLRAERNTPSEVYTPKGSILCLAGPPGVGKTSLGQSIARALGRKFIRISLGGMHDESEIRGHRRTYLGALPGRIIQSLKRAGSKNPVLMLDEIDKVGTDFRGDPSSALLEVLDPAQNKTFNDHYLDVEFDLSEVMFICTANQLEPIQAPLRDRMEIIILHGYTEDDKLHIAKNYLVPRQILENGLREEEIHFKDKALRQLASEYTRETGVRNLERVIGAVCRKIAILIAKNKVTTVTITAKKLADLLGKPTYYSDVAERTTIPGVATGLAVTSVGGDILFIEATKMPGSKGFMITGQLGEVMKESAQAALSYVRSKTNQLGIKANEFEKIDVHIHIPVGAIPKDGPSAGVTMATALASMMTNRPVRNDVAMTGEITLRGKVLPVGGIKEKVLAAHRAGLTTVILPKRNEKDIDDLPKIVRNSITFIFAETVNQVFDAALGAPLLIS
jgi:ATP-dependent Lon protease